MPMLHKIHASKLPRRARPVLIRGNGNISPPIADMLIAGGPAVQTRDFGSVCRTRRGARRRPASR